LKDFMNQSSPPQTDSSMEEGSPQKKDEGNTSWKKVSPKKTKRCTPWADTATPIASPEVSTIYL
jgi:hypothetical protein